MKKKYLFLLSSLLITLALSFPALSKTLPHSNSQVATKEKQTSLTPIQIINKLKQGNQRFVNNEMRDYDYAKKMKVTTKYGQFPLAIILSCMDSRSIPDILFDQGLGNIFVARVAGNVADKNILGSMEFATEVAGSRVILVMGHTHCGAMRGACQAKASGNLRYLLSNIKPAVDQVKKKLGKQFDCNNMATINAIAKQNVINQLKYIYKNSKVIRQLVAQKKIVMLGAMHNLNTGKVMFFPIKYH